MLLAFVRGIALISPFLTNHACAGKAYNGSSDYDSGALGPSPTQSFHGSDFEPCVSGCVVLLGWNADYATVYSSTFSSLLTTLVATDYLMATSS